MKHLSLVFANDWSWYLVRLLKFNEARYTSGDQWRVSHVWRMVSDGQWWSVIVSDGQCQKHFERVWQYPAASSSGCKRHRGHKMSQAQHDTDMFRLRSDTLHHGATAPHWLLGVRTAIFDLATHHVDLFNLGTIQHLVDCFYIVFAHGWKKDQSSLPSHTVLTYCKMLDASCTLHQTSEHGRSKFEPIHVLWSSVRSRGLGSAQFHKSYAKLRQATPSSGFVNFTL